MLHRKTIDLITEDMRKKDDIGVPVTLDELVNLIESLGGKCYSGKIETDSKLRLTKKEKPPFFAITHKNTLDEKTKRFVVAEELGHLLLHMLRENGELKKSDYSYTPAGNMEARHFAASLLMPEEDFRRIANLYSSGETTNLTRIANFFDTTIQATQVRGAVLGLWK